MKKFTLKSIAMVLLAVGGTLQANAQVVETYPFATWEPSKTSTYVVAKAETAVQNSSAKDVYMVTNDFLGHSLNNRFAITSGAKFEGNQGLLIEVKNNGLSLMNLYKEDIINVTYTQTATSGTYYYIVYNSNNLETGTNYTLASDGSFDITWTTSKSSFRISTIVITSKYITIGATGYATYCNCTDKDVTIKDGEDLKAYIVTAQDGTTATLEEVTTIAPGEGVILKGSAGKHELVCGGSASSKSDNNLLAGITDAAGVQATTADYILANNGGTAVFMKSTGTGYVSSGKAYLKTSTSGAKMLNITFEDNATAVAQVAKACATVSNEAYNVAGQKVGANYRGIVIKNGKKYIK